MKFEKAEIQVISLNVNDVVTASDDCASLLEWD